MRVIITGGHGFLGWHTAARLRALHEMEVVRLGRAEFADPDGLVQHIRRADVVLHLAGVNRAASDEEVRAGNVALATQLAAALVAASKPVRVVYANSIQARGKSPYGCGKAEAGDLIRAATAAAGGSLADVILPNLFGEHGRPEYNSFVATFCHLIANDGAPSIIQDIEVPLLHAQAAAEVLLSAMIGDQDVVIEPTGEPRSVSEILDQIRGFHNVYRNGDIPALPDSFSVDLFNTYRSYTFPEQFPRFATVHADARGELFETVRSHGGKGQSFVSVTRPGYTRGEHYHLRKIERFYVVRGAAEISLRRLLHDEVIRFTVSDDRPGYIDMPTMWVHNLTNVGNNDLVTIFWTDQLLDPDDPDQYPDRVVQETRA
ncbi:NAD-dependent epimerase/dehydratase family protein [Nocardioides sp.]|uniref:polysaccharide biosynthesis C-terminal domain-containing protein n=1 Tax=Nocardioides sp. TaxID=35761 RepID=UPI0037839ACD